MASSYAERLARDFLTTLQDDTDREPDRRWPDLGDAFQFWFEDADGIWLTSGQQLRFCQAFIVLQMIIASDPEFAHLRRYIEVPARFGEDGSLPGWLETETWDREVFESIHGNHLGDRRVR